MNLYSALRLSNKSRVAFVGSGGKTTAISHLAKNQTTPCLISTTTHLGSWQNRIAEKHLIISDSSDWKALKKNIDRSVLVTKPLLKERFQGFNSSEIYQLFQISEKQEVPLFLECDGSRQLPLKYPQEGEPAIPSFVDTVVVSCGMSGIGKPLDSSSVYNPDLFSKISGISEGGKITTSGLLKVLSHPLGGLKNIPSDARRVLLLNQADTPILQSIAMDMANKLLDTFDSIVISSLLNKQQVYAVLEPTAGIILAAGSSTRLGKPKQLLEYLGSTFLSTIIKSCLLARLTPIIVVTGSDDAPIINSIKELSDQIVILNNSNWQEGQSSSIRTGIDAIIKQSSKTAKGKEINIERFPGSAIFLLADLPQIKPTLIRSLVENHSQSLSAVIAPLVDGQRGNPVLFDRITFPALLRLKGDIGGRDIFPQFTPSYIQWHDDSILMDIDTESDYSKLNYE